VCCRVLQCVAGCCRESRVLQCLRMTASEYAVKRVIAVSVLQCVAVCCSVLQCAAVSQVYCNVSE